MTKDIMLYLERKMRNSSDNSRSRSDSRRGRDSRDYEDEEDYRGYRKERSRDSRDSRPYGHKSRNHLEDLYDEDYEDSRDYEDGADYHNYKHIKLTKADFNKWEKMFHNTDGSHGPHYSYDQALNVAEKVGIRFDSYTEKEFYICLNMMYADFGTVVSKHMPPEKVLHFLAEMAKAFFDDPDGPEPSEKLALYYHCIVCCADE